VRIVSFAFLFFIVAMTRAQVKPEPDAELNFNQVMFEHPIVRGASEYHIQITEDTSHHPFNFPVIELKDSFNATIVSNLQFGKSYLWRYCALVKGKRLPWVGPYAFTILPDPNLSGLDLHLRVLQNDSLANAGGLVVIDGLHSIYDRNGKLVWFFPSFNAGYRRETGTDDLRIEKAGTVTTLGGQNGMEFDLTGKRLWVTPVKMKNKTLSSFGPFYNHELIRLLNGHYMLIGLDYGWKRLPDEYSLARQINWTDSARRKPISLGDSTMALTLTGGYLIRKDSGSNYALMNMAQIYEYDKKDNLVWAWHARDYLKDEDIFPKGGILDSQEVEQEPHMNGFSMDEKNEYIYVSFRNLNRIVKVEKRTGQVVYSWGEKRASGQAVDGADFFRQQHAPVILKNGNILLFNDGDMKEKDVPSSVEIISQPTATEHSKIVWQYDCIFDSVMANNKSSRAGNAELLPNNDVLVCMGAMPRVFEVTMDKKVVWSSIVEKDTSSKRETMAHALYRAHFTSSLYPCYFTITTDRDTLTSSNKQLTLHIYNDGTENDSYKILVSSGSNSSGEKIATGIVASRHSASFVISPKVPPAEGEKIIISVRSDNNTDNRRLANVFYK
jgi:hypothetical protein